MRAGPKPRAAWGSCSAVLFVIVVVPAAPTGPGRRLDARGANYACRGRMDGGRGREVDVLERVAAAVDTGSLSVPDRGDAVPVGVRIVVQHLGAHVRGRGQLLVARGQEGDVMFREQLRDAGQRQVIAC